MLIYMSKNHLERNIRFSIKARRLAVWIVILSVMSACTSHQRTGQDSDLSECHAIYDAGSSGTRLYIYQQSGQGWLQHVGPEVGSLADPVRKAHGESMKDADNVIREVVGAMDLLLQPGPANKKGQSKWAAFDWQSVCQLSSVAVYATAGMRLAEEKHPKRSQKIWDKLNSALVQQFNVPVVTRTISGFEEGVYAWLATAEQHSSVSAQTTFGISEMGGGSAQLTFPCTSCPASRIVMVHGKPVPLFSRSYLGLGQDEAWHRHPDKQYCKHAAGVENEQWRVAHCEKDISFSEQFEKDARTVLMQNEITQWYLTGAFKFTRPDDIDRYCLDSHDSGYQKKTSCFRAIYQSRFLQELGVPVDSTLSDADWTLGALLCERESCLSRAGPPECQWASSGCQ